MILHEGNIIDSGTTLPASRLHAEEKKTENVKTAPTIVV